MFGKRLAKKAAALAAVQAENKAILDGFLAKRDKILTMQDPGKRYLALESLAEKTHYFEPPSVMARLDKKIKLSNSILAASPVFGGLTGMGIAAATVIGSGPLAVPLLLGATIGGITGLAGGMVPSGLVLKDSDYSREEKLFISASRKFSVETTEIMKKILAEETEGLFASKAIKVLLENSAVRDRFAEVALKDRLKNLPNKKAEPKKGFNL